MNVSDLGQHKCFCQKIFLFHNACRVKAAEFKLDTVPPDESQANFLFKHDTNGSLITERVSTVDLTVVFRILV